MTSLQRALNKLCKWRSVLTGWQLGTRTLNDPEAQAVRDHRDATMMLRVEVTSLVSLLIEKKVFTVEEWSSMMEQEAGYLDKLYEAKFPGMQTTEFGVEYTLPAAAETMRGWKP